MNLHQTHPHTARALRALMVVTLMSTVAARAHAQETSLDVRHWQTPPQPPAAKVQPAAVAATAVESANRRGALGWEIVGGTVPAVAGLTLVGLSLFAGRSGGGGHVPSFRVNTPLFMLGGLVTVLGPAGGVALVGNATGGRGSVGFTYLGSLVGFPLGLLGLVGGAVVGYRASVDDEPPPCASAATLRFDGRF